MKRKVTVIVFLLLIIGVAANAQGVIYIPAIWSDGQVQSAAAIALNDGDVVSCAQGGAISFIKAPDKLSAAVKCASIATSTPASTNTAPPIDTVTPAPSATPTPLSTATVTVGVTPIPTATSTATFTPEPPTSTVAPTIVPATSTPIPPTATPGATVQPFAGAPLCPSHATTVWHSLWDSVRGCHYDHTHNADPAEGNGVFGPAGAAWGGATISYPWLTGDGMEQTMKHNGYKYVVELGLPQIDLALNWSVTGNNGITDARVEHHRAGGVMDLTVRLHSFYQEVRICKPSNPRCGIMKFGGWSDYGILHSPYKQTRILLPGVDPSPVSQSIQEDPYRSARPQADAAQIAGQSWANCRTCGATNESLAGDVWSLWSTSPGRYGFNKLGGTATIVFDDWQGIVASNPSQLDLLCDPAVNPCRFNNSEHQLFTIWAYVPPSLDTDGDGWATYTGYTDRMGNIVQGCTTPTMDCVPLSIQDAPVGYAGWTVPTNNGKWLTRWHEYDLSPGNEWWLQFPN